MLVRVSYCEPGFIGHILVISKILLSKVCMYVCVCMYINDTFSFPHLIYLIFFKLVAHKFHPASRLEITEPIFAYFYW